MASKSVWVVCDAGKPLKFVGDHVTSTAGTGFSSQNEADEWRERVRARYLGYARGHEKKHCHPDLVAYWRKAADDLSVLRIDPPEVKA